MDRVYYFKELIALIVGLIIVLFPLVLRYVFYRFLRPKRGAKAEGKQAPVARKSRSRLLAPAKVQTPPEEAKRLPDEQFLKRIQRKELESIDHLEITPLGPENVYPPISTPAEIRTPEDTVLPENTFDNIIGKTEERSPEDTVLPGATLSSLLNDSDDTVLPKSALDRIFPESRENEQVIASQNFGRAHEPAEDEAGTAGGDEKQSTAKIKSPPITARAARRRKMESTRSTGWSRLNRLPPLKRAIVLSEVLGSPKAIAPGNTSGFAQGAAPGTVE